LEAAGKPKRTPNGAAAAAVAAAATASAASVASVASVAAPRARCVFETGSWKIVPTPYLLSLSGEEPLAECRILIAAGVLRTLSATEEDLLRAETFDKHLILSHRWEDPTHPDLDCTKLKELQKVLRKRPEIEGVWMDFPCLPQGKKTQEEKAFFDHCLRNVNLLYLHGNVLVFLDKEYNTRFWTQYEFFLCSHKATPQGLVPKTKAEFEMRVTIVSIGAAAFSQGKDAESLIATWNTRTAAQAVEILGKADVKVTNKKDKEKLLPKLLEFEKELQARAAIVPFWVDVAKKRAQAEEEEERAVQAKTDAEAKAKAEVDRAVLEREYVAQQKQLEAQMEHASEEKQEELRAEMARLQRDLDDKLEEAARRAAERQAEEDKKENDRMKADYERDMEKKLREMAELKELLAKQEEALKQAARKAQSEVVLDKMFETYTFTGTVNEAGRPQGKGVAKAHNGGNSYEGGFQDGRYHGKGTYTYANGAKYEGDFVDDKMHGKGTYTYANGAKYEGDFVEGKKRGKGTFTCTEYTYEGDWMDNAMHGKGTYTYASGSKYVGDWVDDTMHGQGTMTYAKSGAKYEGGWARGKKHGQGTFTWANVCEYVGEYAGGKRHGKGTFTWARSGIEYVGGWVDDRRTGQGTQAKTTDGTVIYSGAWQNDKPA
jgi:hypothetical protein